MVFEVLIVRILAVYRVDAPDVTVLDSQKPEDRRLLDRCGIRHFYKSTSRLTPESCDVYLHYLRKKNLSYGYRGAVLLQDHTFF